MTTKLYKQNKITQKTLHEWNNVKKKKKAMKQEGRELELTKASGV